jgi:hypothetical protein
MIKRKNKKMKLINIPLKAKMVVITILNRLELSLEEESNPTRRVRHPYCLKL